MSTLTTTSGVSGLLRLVQADLVAPLARRSIAARVSTPFRSTTQRVEIPVITEDAQAAWIAEGAEITADDPSFNTISVVPKKVAGITAISNEAIASANGSAASMTLDSLVRDISTKLDAAFFGNLSSPAPAGLGALSGVTALGSDLVTLDVFEVARIEAAKLGETITSFVTNPDTLLSLAIAKESTTSRRPLLAPSPVDSSINQTSEDVSLMISGVPVYASPAVAADTIWGIPRRTTVLVISGDPDLATSEDAGFKNDLTYVRATLRAGFAFTRPASIVKITIEDE